MNNDNTLKRIKRQEEKEEILDKKETLTEALRNQIRRFIETLLQEELLATLGIGFYERGPERQGYRHGKRERTISTSFGKTTFNLPRARIFQEEGDTEEWESKTLPRYARRTKDLDDGIISLYLNGTNTRKIKKALRPLLKDIPLSKSTVSRIVANLKEELMRWRNRPLDKERCLYLYLDGFGVKVRIGWRVVRCTILLAVGVREDGEKVLLGMEMMNGEKKEAWRLFLDNMVNRGLRGVRLVIIDGSLGLRQAVEEVWPGVDIQRCTVHKARNLGAYVPEYLKEEVLGDFRAIVYAKGEDEAREAKERFLEKWRKRCPGVARSLEEAGEELITFYRYPSEQWRSLRSTNVIERVYEEFRRRIKTQGSFPSEDAVLVVLFGLFVTGQVKMRRISGYKEMSLLALTGA